MLVPTYGDDGEWSKVGQAARLRVQIESNLGYIAIHEWSNVQLTKQVLDGNLAELVSLLEPFEQRADLALEVFREGADPDHLESLSVETVRLLHNFVASVKSLVDHTRKVVRKDRESRLFQQQYEARKDDLIGQPVAKFVQNLRDYVLHRGPPRIIGSFQLRSGTAVVCLVRDDLARWSKWSAPARRWLESQPERIPVLLAVQQYDDLVSDLYDWLWKRLADEHAEDMAEVDRLDDQRQALYGGVPRDPDDPTRPFTSLNP